MARRRLVVSLECSRHESGRMFSKRVSVRKQVYSLLCTVSASASVADLRGTGSPEKGVTKAIRSWWLVFFSSFSSSLCVES